MPFEEASTSLELLHPQQSAATNQQTKNIEQKEEDKEKPWTKLFLMYCPLNIEILDTMYLKE